MHKKIIGYVKQETINTLNLKGSLETPIYIGQTNIDHMEKEHPDDFKKYSSEIEDIISNPDFLALHPNDGSIQFIKTFQTSENKDYVLVAVRATKKSGIYYAKTLFIMNDEKVKRYQEKKYMKQITKKVSPDIGV